MAVGFSVVFFGLALALGGLAMEAIFTGLTSDKPLAESLLKALNMAVISLATFELGLGVHKEYASQDDDSDVLVILRRTVARFVSIVCIALVLEGLLMVIKYSQLDLAGNLPYPVAIVASAALLLTALGAFLRLSRDGSQEHIEETPASGPWIVSSRRRRGES
jgi:hypothetical protein